MCLCVCLLTDICIYPLICVRALHSWTPTHVYLSFINALCFFWKITVICYLLLYNGIGNVEMQCVSVSIYLYIFVHACVCGLSNMHYVCHIMRFLHWTDICFLIVMFKGGQKSVHMRFSWWCDVFVCLCILTCMHANVHIVQCVAFSVCI
jgi:hypothetical protein